MNTKLAALALLAITLLHDSTQAQTKINLAITSDDKAIVPEVIITFPNGNQKKVAASETFAIDQLGKYTVQAIYKRKPNNIADEVFGQPPFTIQVPQKDSIYKGYVHYQKIKGTGMIWIPSNSNQLIGLNHTKLIEKIDEPELILETPSTPHLVAIDTNFNIWYWDNEYFCRINNRDITNGVAKISLKVPASKISGSLFNANSMRIDKQNKLWVSLMNEKEIIGFDLTKLQQGKDAKPDIILNVNLAILDFAFSTQEDKLAVCGIGGFVIVSLPEKKSSNGQSIQLTPFSKSEDVGTFTSVDFDKDDNLWATSENGGVFMFSKKTIDKPIIKSGMQDIEIETADYVYWGIRIDNGNNIWAMPRWEDGNVGIDFFENRNLELQSKPTSFVFPRNVEHGKFLLNAIPD